MKDNKDKTTKNKEVKIDKETNIAKLVFEYPQAAEVLSAFGLHCVGCFASAFDTLGQGAEIHGMDDDELNEMIDEVNKVLNDPEKYN